MDWGNIFSALIGGLIGGGFSLAVLALEQRNARKQHRQQLVDEHQRWLRTEKVSIYYDLASVLDSIEIIIDPENMRYDQEAYAKKLRELRKKLQEMSGRIALLCSSDIKNELVKLQSMLFQLSSQQNTVDFSNFKASPAWETVTQAKLLIFMMSKELDMTSESQKKQSDKA